MGTTIRPELSEKNPYWIEKHRYYELKHFCLQYPIWKKAYLALDGLAKRPTDLVLFSNRQHLGDPTAKCAEARIFYSDRMDLVKLWWLKKLTQCLELIFCRLLRMASLMTV